MGVGVQPAERRENKADVKPMDKDRVNPWWQQRWRIIFIESRWKKKRPLNVRIAGAPYEKRESW